jgi:hypothetical protein
VDAGAYAARVQDAAGMVWSLPANLRVSTNAHSGGRIDFNNWLKWKVYDIDNLTPLAGSNYVAQLYAGPSVEQLRPAGTPMNFHTGVNAGYHLSQIVTLGNVAPGETAVCQVRAWESAFGRSFEEARALGGKFGKSSLVDVFVGPYAPYAMAYGTIFALPSFSLQAGLPYCSTGKINLLQREADGTILWALQGEPGSRYVVEKCIPSEDNVWQPLTVLTNQTGTVFFGDAFKQDAKLVFLRARILD